MNEIDTEVLHKEIDLIQSCISRMAHNSFLIRGWAISVIALVLSLTAKMKMGLSIWSMLILVIVGCWYLDAFFLLAEKRYRAMYKWVLEKRQSGSAEKLYDLEAKRFKNAKDEKNKIITLWSVFKNLAIFYVTPALLISLIFFLHAKANKGTSNCTGKIVDRKSCLSCHDITVSKNK